MKNIILVLFLLSAHSAWSQTYQEKIAASKALIDKPIQTHQFYTLDKQTISFENLNGQSIVAYFFASWCSPCYASLKNLNAAIGNVPSTVRVVAVSLDEDWDDLQGMLDKTGFTGEVWKSSDATAVLTNRLFANFSGSLPYVIKVDAKGILREGGSRIKTTEQWLAVINQSTSLSEASKL
ncbi:TlpA family protein disulfide reductase [Alteromonas gracilis]|uniref:TlpA family protein disulfide reductase n=1 Tax=Alteromonas gracilis TaxID=1479524 RepID=UPI0030D02D95